MGPVRSERLKSIFLRAAEADGAEREAVLREECGEDVGLRRRVEELLAHNDEPESMDILPAAKDMEAPTTLTVGRLVTKRFRVQRFVGRGGMGEVYEVSDEELGGALALKILLPGLIEDEEMVARFRREAHLARQVTHPNLCRIYDVGRERVGGKDLLYLTMELVDGETLTDFLKREKKVAPAVALDLLTQMAAGLRALHEKKIVHRDLKPSNVMLVGREGGGLRVVIGDFGLARAVIEESQDRGLSRSGLVVGTPGYMSPEQQAGQRVSTATDVYAFGVLAYEMMTGRRAYPKHQGLKPPPRVRVLSPEAPAEWERQIMACLEQDPRRRPSSAEAVVRAMARPAEKSVLRRKWWLGGVAAVVVAGVAWVLVERRGGAEQEAAELLGRGFQSGTAERVVALLEPKSRTTRAGALTHALLARGYSGKYLLTREGAWLEKAQAEGLRAVEQDGGLGVGHLALGEAFLLGGKTETGAKELEAALRIEPGNGEARLALGTYLLDRGEWEAARKELEAAGRLAPDDAAAYAALGLLELRMMRLGEAKAAFERELALRPSVAVYSRLGQVAIQMGDFDGGAGWLEQAILLDPKAYAVWADLALCQRWSIGSTGKAKESFLKAIALAKEQRAGMDGTELARLAGLYAAVEDKRASAEILRAAEEKDTGTAEMAIRMGEAFEMLGQREPALRWVRMALQRGVPMEAVRRNPELAKLRGDGRLGER